PDGKYIYFSSNRIKPDYPTGMENASLYRMSLENYDEPYRISKFDEMFKESDKETVKKDSTTTKNDKNSKDKKAKPAEKDEKKDDKKVLVSIDVQGLSDRITQVSPQGGTQYNPLLFAKGDKTYVFYRSEERRVGKVWRLM